MESVSQLTSWNQAFEDYPIVQTRAIEKQLRSDIALNKQKLRNLVGGSYRDLLATAEQIVTLDDKTTAVEGQISELGRNCRPKQYAAPQNGTSKHSDIAQLRLLHKCCSSIATCLKTDQITLAAKILAISRLLHTSLSKQEHPPKILEVLFEQLSRSRRRLLRRIDRRLDDASIEQDELTEVICAFCLSTSSSCNDAIHHFQHRRLGQIRHSAQGTHGDHQHTTKTFKYWIDSLRSTKQLLGRDVPRVLRKLQQTAILQDQEVLKLEQLSLSSLRKLMPFEIQAFTPYIKKSELSEHDAQALLDKWSSEAFEAVQSQLKTHLETLDVTTSAFQLRQELLTTWLESCFSAPAHEDILDILRAALNKHIKSLLSTQVSALANIATHLLIPAPPDASTSTATTPAIWSSSLTNTPLTNSATPYLTALRTHALGSSPSLTSTSCSLSTWCASITSLRHSLSTLSKIRWQDHLEDYDESDEDSAQKIIHSLSLEDPESFSRHLETVLASSLTQFQSTLSSAAKATTSVQGALHLLRGIREARLQLHAALPEADVSNLESGVPSLHGVIAAEVVRRLALPVEGASSSRAKELALELLPENLPSPAAFQLLRTLCKVMLEVGGVDTWTPAAVKMVRRKMSGWIWGEDGDKDGSEWKSRYVRNEFDEVYIRRALGGTAEEMGSDRVRKAAMEYWERTRLLFGVLDV